jgi:hypothetical protein
MVRGIERSDVFRSDTESEHFEERLAEVLEDARAKGCARLSS